MDKKTEKGMQWFEEVYCGVLVVVLCDENGFVYDVWFTYGSVHESKAYRIRKTKSRWFRMLVESHGVYRDEAYEYVEGVIERIKSCFVQKCFLWLDDQTFQDLSLLL